MSATGIWRHSDRDAWLVALACVHGGLLLSAPSVPLVAIGLWWNANTIAHNFIHLPFFRSRRANAWFARYLSLVLGLPQSVWRARHLAHHAEVSAADAAATLRGTIRAGVWRWTRLMTWDTALVAALWLVIALVTPRGFAFVYLPGWLAGLALCLLQGHFEHADGTTSHRGRLYNLLFFNDGLHGAHHSRPHAHWTHLPAVHARDERFSRWPPVLRWLDHLQRWRPSAPSPGVISPSVAASGTLRVALDNLERLVLMSSSLQHFVLAAHERALRVALAPLPTPARVTVVGGGLFPRSAVVMRRLYPKADITVVDTNPEHLERARPSLPVNTRLECRRYRSDEETRTDLLVIPLAFSGDRQRIYSRCPAPIVVVHDWLWHRRGRSARVSFWLLKRVNVIVR